MGCDGGTIPRRDELVRTKQKPEQVDKDAETVAKWKHCAISQERLKSPIVSCELGRLYNKDSVIEFLLNKESTCETAAHIRTLKDIVELNLSVNNGYKETDADKGDVYIDRQASKFICPVVGLEMNGKYKFCYLRGCACVLSEKALKELKSETCHKCGKPFTDDDVIILNGTDEEIALQEERMMERRTKAKMERASRKEMKKHKLELQEKCDSIEKKSKVEGGVSEMTSGVTSSVAGGSKAAGSTKSKLVSANSTVDAACTLALPQKARTTYSIAKDPGASEAYKSLFTSHQLAKNQMKAHWITHNPLYY